MFFLIKPQIAGLIILSFLLIAVMSCSDPVQRHKVLTFFFDGVPPLDGELPKDKKTMADANSENRTGQTQPPQKLGLFVHEPEKDCTLCHGEREKRSFSSYQIKLSAPMPQLCYKCHDDHTHRDAFVHGPVAVGDCLFCHNPHRSKNAHLLKSPVPELCYQCHEKARIEAIPNHSKESFAACTVCHEAHTSQAKSFLKKDWEKKAN